MSHQKQNTAQPDFEETGGGHRLSFSESIPAFETP